MNHSPLETAIIFHLGIVPISRTVVTTWGLMAALTVASWIVTRGFRVDARRMAGDDRNRGGRN